MCCNCWQFYTVCPSDPLCARLVIPWSSLATGKVSLVVSGIHIEAGFPVVLNVGSLLQMDRCVSKNGYTKRWLF